MMRWECVNLASVLERIYSRHIYISFHVQQMKAADHIYFIMVYIYSSTFFLYVVIQPWILKVFVAFLIKNIINISGFDYCNFTGRTDFGCIIVLWMTAFIFFFYSPLKRKMLETWKRLKLCALWTNIYICKQACKK